MSRRPPVMPLVASLGLGLAPLVPEPHVVEKLRWLVEGHPFRAIDAFDLVLHGAPWVWLAVAVVGWLRPGVPAPATGAPDPEGVARRG